MIMPVWMYNYCKKKFLKLLLNVCPLPLIWKHFAGQLIDQLSRLDSRGWFQSVVGRGTPFHGPKLGSCLTLGKELSKETRADKARDFIGKGHPGGEQEGKGTQENCSALWLTVLGFMVMGLVSGWSLANHSNSESFLVAHALLSQDGC